MRVHDANCEYVAGTTNECECRYADDGEWVECAHCRECTAIDSIVHHGEDFGLCPKCSNAFVASVRACHHWYDLTPTYDEYGDEGRVCHHCGVFVDCVDLAMRWAPFICDGFVDIVGDAA